MKRLFSASHSSVDSKEMKKFQLLAQKWWDEEGEYSALHSMNDIRVPFIRYDYEDRFLLFLHNLRKHCKRKTIISTQDNCILHLLNHPACLPLITSLFFQRYSVEHE